MRARGSPVLVLDETSAARWLLLVHSSSTDRLGGWRPNDACGCRTRGGASGVPALTLASRARSRSASVLRARFLQRSLVRPAKPSGRVGRLPRASSADPELHVARANSPALGSSRRFASNASEGAGAPGAARTRRMAHDERTDRQRTSIAIVCRRRIAKGIVIAIAAAFAASVAGTTAQATTTGQAKASPVRGNFAGQIAIGTVASCTCAAKPCTPVRFRSAPSVIERKTPSADPPLVPIWSRVLRT
jgi:hypothetical protein